MSKHLYHLIRSLSPAEKRSFDLWGNRYGGTLHYIALYQEIVGMFSEKPDANFSIDERKLAERLQTKGIDNKAFMDAKAYLYKMLLLSLRIQHEDESHESIIRANLEEAKLLERRGMVDAAIERYELALKDARKYQHHSATIEALKCLIFLKAQLDSKNYVENIHNLLFMLEVATGLLKEQSYLFSNYSSAFVLVRTQKSFLEDARRVQIDQILEAIDLIKTAPTDFFSRIYWHSAKASLATVEKNREEAKKHYLKILEIWNDEEHRHLKTEHLRSYIIFLSNYLTFCISTRDKDAFDQNLEVLKNITTKNLEDEVEHFQNLMYVEHFHFLNAGNLEKADKLVGDIEKGFLKYTAKVNKARERTLRFNMMLTSFGLEKFDDAINQIEHLTLKSPHREDLTTASKLFELIIQYKRHNHNALDTRVRSLIENLKYNDNLHDFERSVLKHLSKLIKIQQTNTPDNRDKSKDTATAFQEFFDEMKTLQNKEGFRKPSGFDAIVLWVRSNVEKKTFEHLLQVES